MRLQKIFSVLAIIMLASQAICGLHLASHPEVAADGGTGFHTVLGIATLVVVIIITIGIFRSAKKAA